VSAIKRIQWSVFSIPLFVSIANVIKSNTKIIQFIKSQGTHVPRVTLLRMLVDRLHAGFVVLCTVGRTSPRCFVPILYSTPSRFLNNVFFHSMPDSNQEACMCFLILMLSLSFISHNFCFLSMCYSATQTIGWESIQICDAFVGARQCIRYTSVEKLDQSNLYNSE